MGVRVFGIVSLILLALLPMKSEVVYFARANEFSDRLGHKKY